MHIRLTLGMLLVSLVTFNACVGSVGPCARPSGDGPGTGFATPVRSANWRSNAPLHGATLAAAPLNVVIDFFSQIAPGSSISIKSNGAEYARGDTLLAEGGGNMRRAVDAAAPDGLYEVAYTVSLAGGGSENGRFQFAIDRSKISEYADRRGQAEVGIALNNLLFAPAKVRVSPGTTIVWTNQDLSIHFVNSDNRATRNYYPAISSPALAQGDTYSLVLTTPGIYLYHCSTHPGMDASIVVE